MRRSTARSSIAIAVVGFLCIAPPALASLATAGAGAPAASSLRIYGAYLPDRVEWEDTHWGYGFVARTALNPRWGVDIGAARFTSSDRALTPMTIGFAYGPESREGLRPWVESGLGCYRLDSFAMGPRNSPGFSSSGTYYYVEPTRSRVHEYKVGGYFGLGLDVPLSGRLGLGTGVRIHGWSGPDALIALQSGLTYGL